MKPCNKCGKEKELVEFTKNRRLPSGRGGICSECKNAQGREKRANAREESRAYMREWKQKNKEKLVKWNAEHHKKRMKTPGFRMKHALRNRIGNALRRGYKKSGSSSELIGCDWDVLREHLETQFTEGMTWENYGHKGWHIDHIMPCDSFDLTDPEQQRTCFHYTNLQPLWAKDNLEKGAKLPLDKFGSRV